MRLAVLINESLDCRDADSEGIGQADEKRLRDDALTLEAGNAIGSLRDSAVAEPSSQLPETQALADSIAASALSCRSVMAGSIR